MSENNYAPKNIELLKKLHTLARKEAASYSMSYDEWTDTWFITISAPKNPEVFVGKNQSYLEQALEDAIEFLENLQ